MTNLLTIVSRFVMLFFIFLSLFCSFEVSFIKLFGHAIAFARNKNSPKLKYIVLAPDPISVLPSAQSWERINLIR